MFIARVNAPLHHRRWRRPSTTNRVRHKAYIFLFPPPLRTVPPPAPCCSAPVCVSAAGAGILFGILSVFDLLRCCVTTAAMRLFADGGLGGH